MPTYWFEVVASWKGGSEIGRDLEFVRIRALRSTIRALINRMSANGLYMELSMSWGKST